MIMKGWIAQLLEQIVVGVWSTNWPLIVLPILTSFCSERLAFRLDPTSDHGRRKIYLATLLTALPGLVFVSLGVNALNTFSHARVDSALCVVVLVFPIIIFSIGLCRASVAGAQQYFVVRQLRKRTIEADRELCEFAASMKLTIRILHSECLSCMTLGIVKSDGHSFLGSDSSTLKSRIGSCASSRADSFAQQRYSVGHDQLFDRRVCVPAD